MPSSGVGLPDLARRRWLDRLRKPSPSGDKGGRGEDDEAQEEEDGSGSGDVYEPDELAEKVLNMIRNGRAMRLEDAVQAASSAFGARPEEVARRIYELSSAGMVAIRDPDPPRSVARFLREPAYSAWYWALLALVAGTVAVVAASPGAPLIYARYALGALFVLYLPGAALIELLYPKKSDLSQLERLALSLGLSLALVPLVGLVLNYTPWGIRLEPILASVSLLTVGLATGAVVRKLSYVRLQAAALGASARRSNA